MGAVTLKVKIVIIIITASILLSVGGIGIGVAVSDSLRRAETERIFTEAAPLELERQRLEREIKSFNRLIEEPIPGGATLTVVATNLREEVYTELFAILEEASDRLLHPEEEEGDEPTVQPDQPEDGEPEQRPFVGTLVISPSQLPGTEGNITREQFDEMLEAGWTTALSVSSAQIYSLDSYLSTAYSRFTALGIEMPKTAYFGDASYSEECDETLKRYGISTVMHTNYEDYEIVTNDASSDMWRVTAIGWSGVKGSITSATDTYDMLLVKRGAVAFTLEIWYDNRLNASHYVPVDSTSSFTNMINIFGEKVASGDLFIQDAPSGKEQYAAYLEQYDFATEKYEPQLNAMLDRLAEIKAELDRIYNRHR